MPNLPLLLGHRGVRVSTGVPENTFAAFDLALAHGCDGFEFDVRLTACGRALVCHDPKVQGITVSRAQSHQLLDLHQLEDVLVRYGRVFLDIELKVEDLESKVLGALREHHPETDYVISSFLPDVVMELKARSATVPLGIICDQPKQLESWRALPVEYVIAHHSLVDRKLVQEVQDAKRRIFIWTVNETEAMLRFAGWGVDGIISDDAQLLVRTLRSPMRKPESPDAPSLAGGR
jgi:glycerophosphoryl diester phosphodiesterase